MLTYISEMSKRPSKLRKWTDGCMVSAFNEVKAGTLNIKAAARKYNVPRMTLSDRVHGIVKLKSVMGVKTALTAEEEQSLCNYISYMANRGFPLSIPQIKGFAWCIAKESGKGDTFTQKGPSWKWWLGFRKRHPDLGLRRPDSLDRGRASLGCVDNIRDYFALLKDTIDSNDLGSKPQCIYNCDEAALFLNKSAGQKVVVPARMKHAHSLAVASNEHISVHCCVNAAGQSLPPMIIFSKGLPGGAYHRQGPVNASYAFSDSGFMDQNMYLQWFEKTFLKHAAPQRPLLLIQDGASSHVSVSLIRSAIANDVILLCLPAKTTHITQPLDVAVYRKMKIETAKVVSQAKMVKSDMWVSKKQISGIFKVIFERSFTMECITEGFRKCGIHPYNPNAIDKTMLLRSCTEVDATNIDLSDMQKQQERTATDVESTTDDHEVTDAGQEDPTPEDPTPDDPTPEDPTPEDPTPDVSFCMDVSFLVGEDGILTLQSEPENTPEPADINTSTNTCPPELALAAIECSLTPRKKRKFQECLRSDVAYKDKAYNTWKDLKLKISVTKEAEPVEASEPPNVPSTPDNQQSDPPSEMQHPLVKAGLIPENLVNVLVAPPPAKTTTIRKNKGRAKVLTSEEVQQELEEREAKKIKEIEEKIKRKQEREEKKAIREVEMKKRKEDILMRKEAREKMKKEKQDKADERKKKKLASVTSSTTVTDTCTSFTSGHDDEEDCN